MDDGGEMWIITCDPRRGATLSVVARTSWKAVGVIAPFALGVVLVAVTTTSCGGDDDGTDAGGSPPLQETYSEEPLRETEASQPTDEPPAPPATINPYASQGPALGAPRRIHTWTELEADAIVGAATLLYDDGTEAVVQSADCYGLGPVSGADVSEYSSFTCEISASDASEPYTIEVYVTDSEDFRFQLAN
jgi:hypothetical protein